MRDSCKTQARKKTLYNYIQLGLAGTFVILTYHQLSAAAATARPWCKICASERSHLFRSRPPSTSLYREKLPERTPYVCVYSIFPQFISQALRNGPTPPRHQCQSDEWVSNSVWSSHQRHAALNAQPWEKAGRGKDFIRIRDEEGGNNRREWHEFHTVQRAPLQDRFGLGVWRLC